MKTVKEAKRLNHVEVLKRQLFIGKVSDEIGADRTIELLRETYNEIK